MCVLVLCTQVNMMFVMLLRVCIHTGLKSLPDHGGNRTRDTRKLNAISNWATRSSRFELVDLVAQLVEHWTGKLFSLPGVDAHSE
jgi:hypothetical protein